MTHYVYIHCRLDNNSIFYIGKGSGNRHSSKQKRNRYWNFVASKYGFYSKILKTFDSESEAFYFEKILLKKAVKKLNLVNHKPGGVGGRGGKLSEGHRKNISIALTRRIRKRSTYEKISNALRGSTYKRPRKKGFPSNNRKNLLCTTDGLKFTSTHEAGRFYNLPYWNIAAVCRGDRKTCGNKNFIYLMDGV